MVMKITIKWTLLMSLATLAAQATDDAGSSAASVNTDNLNDVEVGNDEAVDKIAKLEQKLAVAMEKIAKLESFDANKILKNIKRMTKQCKKSRQEIDSLKNENTAAKKIIQALEKKMNETEESMGALTNENYAAKENIQELEKKINETEESVEALGIMSIEADDRIKELMGNGTNSTTSLLQDMDNRIGETEAAYEILMKETQAHDAIREKQYLEIAGFRTNINKKLTYVTDGLKSYEDKFDSLTSTMTGLSHKMSTLTSDLSKIKTRVFFTVKDPNNKAAYNEPMKFQTIITNVGSGYSAATGAFTAPVSGWYLFTFFYGSSSYDMYAYLRLDGHISVRALADYEKDYIHNDNSAGNAAVLYVKKGQKVTVTGGSNSFNTTPTFTGVLLSTDY